jgi:hypothetical protein
MSNILEFFAPDMSTDFEELGERIDLDQIGSDEIPSDQQNLPTNLLNVPNDENLIRRDSEYEVTLNKMSIKHLLQNDDVKEVNYVDYFSEITINVKKEITDDVEISPLKLNLLNENDSDDIVRTHFDDVMSSNDNSPQQKNATERESAFSDANERRTVEISALSSIFDTNLLNHVRPIHETTNGPIINLSDNNVLEGELKNPAIVKKSDSGERVTQETAFESSDNLQNFNDKNMSTRTLLVEEALNMSQSEINAQVWD